MSKNDLVLLDGIVDSSKSKYGEFDDHYMYFELFCFDQILKDYETTYDDLMEGWTDGRNDGGIDGIFTFVDGHILSDDIEAYTKHTGPNISLNIFTVKHRDSFQQDPLDKLIASCHELFDLTNDLERIESRYNEFVLNARESFKNAFKKLAGRKPRLSINIYYCCRGDEKKISDEVSSRTDQLLNIFHSLFSNTNVSVNLCGSSTLLEVSRRDRLYTLELNYTENFISKEGDNYIVLVNLDEYLRFVSDDKGQLRRYLFEANVRDFMRKSVVNDDIQETLASGRKSKDEDFWWLNNGVTIVATDTQIVGKSIFIENVQIVNGLQTTETIYNYFRFGENGAHNDNRSILVKIIVPRNEEVRARIIKATNYQNLVAPASLRGLDKVQIDIDEYLYDHGWYYDRKANYYKNLGMPRERIVTLPYLAAAVRAVALGKPAESARSRSKNLRNDATYNEIFNESMPIHAYLMSLEIIKTADELIQRPRGGDAIFHTPIALVHFLGFCYSCSILGNRRYSSTDIARLSVSEISASKMKNVLGILRAASSRIDQYVTHQNSRKKVRRATVSDVFLRTDFIEAVIDEEIVEKRYQA